MNTRQEKHLQAVPSKSSGNPAIDKLIDKLGGLETEMKGLRQDLVKVQKRLWLDIGSGVIAGLFVASAFSFVFIEINKANQRKAYAEESDRLIEKARQQRDEFCRKYPDLASACSESK